MALTVGSLFSGIGGLDLGLERAGMEVIWQSEIDPYACKVLSKHWPEVVNHGNIKEINWQEVERPDVICGGYPCQPFSTAGKRRGEEDPRHLWPWVREAISQLRPRYAILENVRGHLSMGGLSVIGELASIGYDAEWRVVSAASVGANHRRDRIVIVAYPNGRRQQECQSESEQTPGVSCGCEQCTDTIGQLADTDSFGHLRRQSQVFTTDRWLNALSLIGSCSTDVANTNSISGHQQHQRQVQQPDIMGRSQVMADPDNNGLSSAPFRRSTRTATNKQSPRQDNTTDIEGRSGISREVANTDAWETSRGLGGVSTDTGQVREQRDYARGEESHAGRQWWATEPDVGRVAHGVPSRVDRLRGLGNAVVPQVAEVIGRLVVEHANA